jgi:hypothetical protein
MRIIDDPKDKIDLTPLLRALPPTLESFTFVSKEEDKLNEKYYFKEFILGLIESGIQDLSFNKIHLQEGHDNITCFNKIFSGSVCYNNLRFIKFHNCPNVCLLDKIFLNVSKAESISLTECNLTSNVSTITHRWARRANCEHAEALQHQWKKAGLCQLELQPFE